VRARLEICLNFNLNLHVSCLNGQANDPIWRSVSSLKNKETGLETALILEYITMFFNYSKQVVGNFNGKAGNQLSPL